MNTLIAVAACWTLLFGGLAGTQPADTSPKGDENPHKPFKVMSFNIRWGGAADPPSVWSKRRDRVLEAIKANDPDVLGVQEAILNQVRFLQGNLAGYVFFGAGRDNGRMLGEMCAIYYRSERFLRIGGGHFWLSERPDEPGSFGWDARFPRMVSWLRLRDKTSRAPMIVANTHWDHKGKEARLNSAKMIREKLPEIAQGDPIVILGDFNCTEDSKPYAELVGGGELEEEGGSPWLIDAYRAAHPDRHEEEATYHGFRGGLVGNRIDWILHTPGFTTIDAVIDRTHEGIKYPSDHYPVTATLQRAD